MPKSDSVGLYWQNQASWEQPFKSLSRLEVHALKAQKKGKFFDHGVKFRLTEPDPYRCVPNAIQPTKEDSARRDGRGKESCIVGTGTMWQFCLGVPRAVQIVNAWAPLYA